MSEQQVLDFLNSNPGATAQQIESELGEVGDVMMRLHDRGEVYRASGRYWAQASLFEGGVR